MLTISENVFTDQVLAVSFGHVVLVALKLFEWAVLSFGARAREAKANGVVV